MATVRDLYTQVSAKTSLGFAEAHHLCRTMQQAGLLPKGARGSWRYASQITREDCARFMITLALTRTSGSRTVAHVREQVEKFSKLVWHGPPHYRETLIDRLAMAMRYEMSNVSVWPMMVTVWDDQVAPTVVIKYFPWIFDDEHVRPRDQVFRRPGKRWTKKDIDSAFDGQMAVGFKMGSQFFEIFRDLLDAPVARPPSARVLRPFGDTIDECVGRGLFQRYSYRGSD